MERTGRMKEKKHLVKPGHVFVEESPLRGVSAAAQEEGRVLLSIVAPMFNEESNVAPFVSAVCDVLQGSGDPYEIILVDDGSSDGTWSRIVTATEEHEQVRGMALSRNFGHQHALLAGMSRARGRAIITMDGDLQHPAEVIPKLVAAWKQGAKVVNTERIDGDGTSWFKRTASRAFYAVFSRLSGIGVAEGTSDFRLLDADVFRTVRQMRDTEPFIRGIVNWLGFPAASVSFRVARRHAGRTKYSLARMLRFSTNALTSFSMVPLRLGIWLGFLTSALAVAEAGYIIVKFFQGATVPGWASVMTFLSFMFAVLFLLVGIIGTYLGHVYEIVKSRPRYVVAREVGFPDDTGSPPNW